jgi:hypothetical protein
MKKSEILQAISELSEECKKNLHCGNCRFHNDHNGNYACLIESEETPSWWKVSQESEEI